MTQTLQMTKTPTVSTHKRELDYVNAIACMLVVLIHVLSYAISNGNIATWQGSGIYLVWRAIAFVVPAFLFTGAVKQGIFLQQKPLTPARYGAYLLARIRKIYVPYLLWHCIYYAVFLRIHYVSGTADDFFRNLFFGTISSQFYYIIIVMQFYALAPVWAWMMRRIAFPVALAMGVLCMFLTLRCTGFLAVFDLSGRYLDRVCTAYLPFWIVGLYVGVQYEKISRTVHALSRINIFFMAALALGCTALSFVQTRFQIYSLDMDYFKVIADLLSIFLLLHFAQRVAQTGGKCALVLEKINRASFFVFLSHGLFITLASALLNSRGITSLSVQLVCRGLAAYVISFSLYFVIQWFKKRLSQ